MSNITAHIIIIDGAPHTGKKMFSFELALALMYNNQKTALVLPEGSSLKQTITKRKQQFPDLPQLEFISHDEFDKKVNNFNAVIILTSANDNLAVTANTFITIIPQNKKSATKFKEDSAYLNSLWELKKKIAAISARSLDWVVCENNVTERKSASPTEELKHTAKLYGFRLCPPLNHRKAYTTNHTGLSAQDKTTSKLKKELTYDDICAKREIIKLAEFIFS